MTAQEYLADLSAFVDACPSAFHAAAEVTRRLVASGFTELAEERRWHPAPGGYVVVRDGAVIAWRQPEQSRPVFRIIGAHTDSPGFKVKPRPSSSAFGWWQAGMEVYGGPLLNSWLDRDVGLAGRVVTRSGETHLVRTGPWLRIPQVAPHLDRSVNENLHLDRQHHLQPVFGVGFPRRDLLEAVAEQAGLAADDIVAHDLHAYVTERPTVIGVEGDLFASPRLDNLSSVHAGLTALLATDSEAITVLACFDHEEVGSGSRSGASGPFLADVLRRIARGLGWGAEEFDRALAGSLLISADAGHAVHPNYPQLHDPDHRPLVNQGPLLKINASQRYASDAVGAAAWYRACAAAGVPTQEFVSNNAVPCGSTIGPLSATRLGVRTVDVGIPLLSMHSARELCGAQDPWWLGRALAACYAD